MSRISEGVPGRPSYASYLEGFDTSPHWYELGRCRDNQVYVSRPIVKAVRKTETLAAINPSTVWKKFGVEDPAVHPVQSPVFKVRTYAEVGLQEVIVNLNASGHYGPAEQLFTAILNEGGDILYPKESNSSCVDCLQNGEIKFNDTQFFSFAGDRRRIIYGLFMYVEIAGEGGELKLDLIQVDESGKAKGFNIIHNYQGS